MGKQINKNNIGYLGIDYQYKLAKLFVEDHSFFEEIRCITNQNAFTDQLLRGFVGTIIDYYDRECVVPSYDILKIILRGNSRSETEVEEWEALIHKLHYEETFEGCNLIKDYAIKFFKQQNLIKVANSILEIAGKGDVDRYEECQKMLDDAVVFGDNDEFGFSPFDIEEKALSQTYTVPIPTGIKLLDESLNGGLAKKKLGVIIGSSGFGKSTLSVAISAFASTYRCDLNNNDGYKVLYIYFEDDDVDIARKYFSRISQVESRFLTSSKQQIDEIKEVLGNYKDRELMKQNLRIKPFPVHKKTATDIGNFVKRMINSGWRPDLVIIDYFECMAPEKGGFQTDSQWAREANTMRTLENIAKELDIAIWVPTQGNKDSITNPELVTMDQAGGSIVKIQAASVIISIARSVEMQANNKATLALIKNRGGCLNVWKGIEFNNGTSTISCDNAVTFDNTLEYQEDAERQKEKNRIELLRQLTEKTKKEREQSGEAQ